MSFDSHKSLIYLAWGEIFMKWDLKKVVLKIILSVVVFIPCVWFGFVLNISLFYLDISPILAYIGLFVFYPLAYGMIWIHEREKVLKYWLKLMCIFIVISIIYFIIFVPAENPIKYQFIKLIM